MALPTLLDCGPSCGGACRSCEGRGASRPLLGRAGFTFRVQCPVCEPILKYAGHGLAAGAIRRSKTGAMKGSWD